jgi:hypothetical protein
MRRYERASTILTSNRPVDDWGKLLGDTAAVTALLARLLHHAHILKCGPRSSALLCGLNAAQDALGDFFHCCRGRGRGRWRRTVTHVPATTWPDLGSLARARALDQLSIVRCRNLVVSSVVSSPEVVHCSSERRCS